MDGVISNNLHNQCFLLKKLGIKVGVVTPYSDALVCGKSQCRKIRIGPLGNTKVCVRDKRTCDLNSLTHQEKPDAFKEIVTKKENRIKNNFFPVSHVPEELRFGIGVKCDKIN